MGVVGVAVVAWFAALPLALPASAKAETVTVTTTQDGNDSECVDDCTLREALATSSSEATIVAPGGTYTLVSGSLSLSGSRTIQGAGAAATRISGPDLRVLMVTSGTPTVTGVRISDGNAPGAGGGVHVASGASFTLRDSLVDHNSATLGGGIYSEGTLTVERSLIQANDAEGSVAAHGGGVTVNGGTATLTNTSLSGNGADGSGGGLHVTGGGTVTLRNVTLAENAASATPPGHAIYQQSGTVTAINTLIAHTEAGACRLAGTISWAAGMVDGADTTCGAGDENLTVGVDTLASFLGNNGGPTLTYALQLGSPAIDAGTGQCPATDQRGFVRPQGGACDIGALEQSLEPVVVDTPLDGEDGECADDCTLREALDDPTAHVIHVPSGTYTLSLDQLQVSRTVLIRAIGASLPTIRPDVEFPHRVIQVVSGATLRLSRVRVAGGLAAGDNGGGILVDSGSALELTESEIAGNEAVWGGGIWADGDLLVRNSLIADNEAIGAEGRGGGIGLGSIPAAATIVNTTVSGNDSGGYGGGIFTRRSMTLLNASIVENTAPPRGIGEPTGRGGGLSQEFFGNEVTTARNVLVARNVNGGCGGTVNDPIDSDNGLVDEPLPNTTCNAVGDGNLIVPDAGVAGLADNGGLTRTHALLAGSPAANAGADCPAYDQRGTARPQGPACDIGAFEAPVPVQQPPQGGGGPEQPPPDDEQEQLPPPTAGEEVNAEVARGTVRVRLPGSNRFVDLSEARQLPVGTVVDTRKGRVTLEAAGGQEATFYDGVFRIGQGKGAWPLTTLTLVEKLSCPRAGRAIATAKKRKRRLWGDGSGRFRTKGKHSAATVVGTRWLVEDRCTSTLTRVVRGRVSVRDFVKKKSVTVRAGKKYTARARKS